MTTIPSAQRGPSPPPYLKGGALAHIPVAPHGAWFDAEAVGELGHRPGAAGLQEVEQREYLSCRSRPAPNPSVPTTMP